MIDRFFARAPLALTLMRLHTLLLLYITPWLAATMEQKADEWRPVRGEYVMRMVREFEDGFVLEEDQWERWMVAVGNARTQPGGTRVHPGEGR